MSNESLELKYHEITALYDLAEELVETVEGNQSGVVTPDDAPTLENIQLQVDLLEPLIDEVGDAADVLSEEFLNVVGEQSKAENGLSRKRVEAALRKIYTAIDVYQKKAKACADKMSRGASNAAEHIIEKIKRQAESIIAIFVDYMDLSLDRIMQKTQIEELKRRQEKIAFMLYNLTKKTSEQR